MSEIATHEPAVRRFPDRDALGRAAARDIATTLVRKLAAQPDVRVVFAAAPSQQETLDALAAEPGIDWQRVTAFHMDEYLGLAPEAPQRFGTWLRTALFDRLPFGTVHLIDPPDADDDEPAARVERYDALLAAAPIDLVCLGIGVNGHLAFNDPPADLHDAARVRVVELDDVCRQQQVDDGCFDEFDDVPRQAITLTVPALLAADELFCMVPGNASATP